MFVPTSQFHLYGYVTSRGHHGDSGDGDGSVDDDDDDDDDDVGDADDEDDTPQLTVVCRAARNVRFYLLNVFLVLVGTRRDQCVDSGRRSLFVLDIVKALQQSLEGILVSRII